jgi:hypothetical protein
MNKTLKTITSKVMPKKSKAVVVKDTAVAAGKTVGKLAKKPAVAIPLAAAAAVGAAVAGWSIWRRNYEWVDVEEEE